MRMPPLPADSIHARACKLKCEKILTRPYIYLSYHIHPKKETWRKSPMSLHIKYYLLSTIEILRIIPLRVMS